LICDTILNLKNARIEDIFSTFKMKNYQRI